MRCHGLTIERRRCIEQTSEGSRYCATHQALRADLQGESTNGPAPATRRFPFGFRSGPSRHLVPDHSTYDLPKPFKSSPTAALAERLLSDPNTLNRWCAAYALRRRRDPEVIDSLWQALQQDPVSIVRQQVAVAIGKIGTSAAIAPLVEALWHDRDAAVRQASAIALGNLGYAHAARHLAEALRREHAIFVRWDSVLALGQLGDHTFEPVLLDLIREEPSQIIRRACVEAIEEIKRR